MNLVISDERLNKIKACEKEIRKTHRDFSYSNIPLDDEPTFDLFSSGNTDGIEEFQSNGDKKWLKHYIKPRNIEELIAFYAMYRPGSMANLPAYVEGKNNPNGITYLEPSFKNILAPTCGILVYREQLVRLVHDYCGCSIEDANKIRLRLQKKKDVQLCRGEFECMSIRQGHGVEETHKVFDYLLGNSAYAIAKSHVIPFVIMAYREAYIKCHFTDVFNEFFLNNDVSDA